MPHKQILDPEKYGHDYPVMVDVLENGIRTHQFYLDTFIKQIGKHDFHGMDKLKVYTLKQLEYIRDTFEKQCHLKDK